MPALTITRSFYVYVCISYAHAGGRTRNGTERNAGHRTGRERPDINTCPSRGFYGLGLAYPRVGRAFNFFNGGVQGKFIAEGVTTSVYNPVHVDDTQLDANTKLNIVVTI